MMSKIMMRKIKMNLKIFLMDLMTWKDCGAIKTIVSKPSKNFCLPVELKKNKKED